MSEAFAHRMAAGLLESLAHYGDSSPAVGDGDMATPAWYASKLRKVLASRGDTLPGAPTDWWGHRWAAYARQVLAS